MSRYHVNPTTGNPGACHAQTKCPFGDLEADHFNTKWEAMKAFEESMADETIAKGHSQDKAIKASASSQDLRDSVRDYRNTSSTEDDRDDIRQFWAEQGVKNQFQAMLTAAAIDGHTNELARPTISSDHFTTENIHDRSDLVIGTASDIDEFRNIVPTQFSIKSEVDGSTIRLDLTSVERDREGELQYWEYTPEDAKENSPKVRIFND
jgi:hypothetical protein